MILLPNKIRGILISTNITNVTYGIKIKIQMFDSMKIQNEYIPYTQDTKEIPLSAITIYDGLKGLNNIYYDEVNTIERKIITRVGKLDITDLSIFELIQIGQTKTNEPIYALQRQIEGYLNTAIMASKFNVLKDNNYSNLLGDAFYVEYTEDNKLNIILPKTITTKEEAIKQINLERNFVLLPLAEIKERAYDTNLFLKTYNEKTYIVINNNIIGNMSFRIPVNNTEFIVSLQDKNLSLKRLIDNQIKEYNQTKEALERTQKALDYVLFNIQGIDKENNEIASYLLYR